MKTITFTDKEYGRLLAILAEVLSKGTYVGSKYNALDRSASAQFETANMHRKVIKAGL